VPLAAIFADLGKEGETEGARQRIARWYRCGVLGELYGGAIETRFAHDLPEVVALVRGEAAELITIQDSRPQATRLLTLRTRNSSAYKGLYALLMRDGGRDFRTGEPIEAQTFFDDKVDIHHIFLERCCKMAGIEPDIYNSVINKTALSARTNRLIGARLVRLPKSRPGCVIYRRLEAGRHCDRQETDNLFRDERSGRRERCAG
jgi:hypothetical protein